jgi:hypothetical protein
LSHDTFPSIPNGAMVSPNEATMTGTQILIARETEIERRTREGLELIRRVALAVKNAQPSQLPPRLAELQREMADFERRLPKGVVLV